MLRKFRETLKNKQRGAIMVFFAILVPLFLGVIGLAVDAGFLYMQKAKLQDVADATALAGAGHLKDENRKEQVEKAIVAFAGANGYGKDKDEAVSSKFPELGDKVDDSNVTLEENAAWKIAYAIDTGMEDKDAKKGELRDHVRVVILKRVPTFFIRMLFPEQNEVVVKAVAAAEYVEGEEPVVSGDTPVIMVDITNIESLQQYQSSNNIRLGKNFNFPIYTRDGNIDPTKLPGTGNLYVNEIPNNICKASYDKDKKDFVWNPPINNRRIFYRENDYPAHEDGQYRDDFEKLKEAYDAERRKADAKYLEVKSRFENEAEAMKQDIDAYKRGDGKKRFIGWDQSEERMINNIREDDKEIELFMQNTYFDKAVDDEGTWGRAKEKSFLTNRQLLNVRKITSLITNNDIFIATTGITYGNIYCLGSGYGLVVSGSNNYFNGTLYTPDELYVGGEENHFLSDAGNSAEVSILATNVYIGKWYPIVETEVWADSVHFNPEGKVSRKFVDKCIRITRGNFVDAKNRPDWRVYFGPDASSGSGSGGSSSGSSGSGAAKAHVRLVI